MKKVLFLLIAIMLVGCTNDSDESIDKNKDDIDDEEVVNVEDDESKASTERSQLPFDINEFNELYDKRLEEYVSEEDRTEILADKEQISIAFGHVNEVAAVLYTIDELIDGNELDTYGRQFVQELIDASFYIDETTIAGLEIQINAIDMENVSISVFNGDVDNNASKITINDSKEDLEGEPLPFDIEEFSNHYYEIIELFDDFSDSERLFIKEDSIALISGHMIEAQALLNVLSKLTEDEAINILTEEFLNDIVQDGFYINELKTSEMDININAIEISSVTLIIKGESE
ncbi:hypothetical protein AB4Y30_11525 [Ornithinibacillus sp. 4-3]|uniref:Lipoprotein n=1 Tax=Ornithinibacillus sp. 4-3 TaxID=3231488 RepID=A0AB39HNQ3_9BACI